ncbi:MAG: Uma2 family endonuclease [Candidatus Nanopelagicales bacterium]
MITLAPGKLQTVNFDDFVAWYPEKSEVCYELHQGIIVAMPKPKGKHSEIAGFLMAELNFEIKRLNLPYVIPRECLIKAGDLSGYEPDVIVLDREKLKNEPRWEKESTITKGETAPLVIEVVSSNWSDDYALKLDAYETLGIQEYWIVDYLGIGGRKFIGNPKQPTLSIFSLQNEEYSLKQYKENQQMNSLVFPEIKLRVSQIFAAYSRDW